MIMEEPMTSGAPIGGSTISHSGDQPPEDEHAAPAVETTEQAAGSLTGQAKQKLTGALDGQKGTAADMIETLAGSVKRSGEQFEGQQDWIASAIGRGATELSTLANTVREKDLGELAGDIQAFGRRQPALFMGAALVVGFGIARLGRIVASDLSRADLPTIPEVGDGQL